MSDDFHRAKLSAAERNFRSQFARLALNRWFLRGSLSERLGKCGKPNCRCTRGELHKSLYLVQSQGEGCARFVSRRLGRSAYGRPSVTIAKCRN